MRLSLKLFACMLLLVFITSCSCSKKNVKNEATIEGDLIKSVSIREADFLGTDSHMSSYDSVDYLVKGIDIRGDKAKVKMTYMVKPKADASVMEADIYNFWERENDKWVLVYAGGSKMTMLDGWW